MVELDSANLSKLIISLRSAKHANELSTAEQYTLYKLVKKQNKEPTNTIEQNILEAAQTKGFLLEIVNNIQKQLHQQKKAITETPPIVDCVGHFYATKIDFAVIKKQFRGSSLESAGAEIFYTNKTVHFKNAAVKQIEECLEDVASFHDCVFTRLSRVNNGFLLTKIIYPNGSLEGDELLDACSNSDAFENNFTDEGMFKS